MKTQISNLINGSENTLRNLAAEKYRSNPIGFFSGKPNVPQFGGTCSAERDEVALKVAAENTADMRVIVNGVELKLTRINSTTGKSWRWVVEISAEQYEEVTGENAPIWSHKGAYNEYEFVIYQDCTAEVFATSGKKGFSKVLGEEFIKII